MISSGTQRDNRAERHAYGRAVDRIQALTLARIWRYAVALALVGGAAPEGLRPARTRPADTELPAGLAGSLPAVWPA